MTIRHRALAVARRHPGLSLVALPCAVTIAVLAAWPAGGVSPADRSAVLTGVVPVAQNRPAPDFTRPDVTGTGRISLRELRGRVVVVNFWASWCTACKTEAPRLQGLAADEQPRGVRFVGVDHEDTLSAAHAFLARFRPDYPSAFDPDGALLHAYGGIGLPSTFIVDRAGRIRYQASGAFSATAFRTALDEVVGDSPGATP